MLLAHGAARAQTYTLQPIAKLGDKVGSLTIKVDDGDFEVGALNDAGQIAFVTENDAGGEMLVQFADGKLTPIISAGAAYPGGTFPDGVGPASPISMNQAGNIVFAALVGTTPVGTFEWDFQAKQLKAIALQGMPAVNNLTFESPGDFGGGVINDSNEIAFAAGVKNAAGTVVNGIFFLGKDNKLVPVVLPDQDLFGGKVNRTRFPAINNAGQVAFHARREGGDTTDSAYLWENGNITQLVVQGQDAPDGHKIVRPYGIWLNKKNKNALVGARLDDITNGPWALYLVADGKLVPVAVPGQDMPGGGKFKSMNTTFGPIYFVSQMNDAGQAAFVGILDDNSTGLYLMNSDGKLSKVMKSGETTSLGKIDNIGEAGGDPTPSSGVALNNKGQIVVTVLPENGDDVLVLLTSPAQ